MPLHKPYFRISEKLIPEGTYKITHNCNGNVDFTCTDEIDEETYRLILWALEEGQRVKSREILYSLGVKP